MSRSRPHPGRQLALIQAPDPDAGMVTEEEMEALKAAFIQAAEFADALPRQPSTTIRRRAHEYIVLMEHTGAVLASAMETNVLEIDVLDTLLDRMTTLRTEIQELTSKSPKRRGIAKRTAGADPGESLEFEVSLKHIKPRIWRRFTLASTATMLDLHRAIQDAFGWTHSHLWEFRRGQPWKGPVVAAMGGCDEMTGARIPGAKMAARSLFADVGSKLTYVYDFGDEWVHDVTLRAAEPTKRAFKRQLIAGKRTCPPEDSGGPYGYDDLVAIWSGELDDAERKEWLGDWAPDTFDATAARRKFDR